MSRFMTQNIRKLAVAMAVALLGAGVALAQADEPINADRPGIADGSKVVGQGACNLRREFKKSSAASRASPITV